LIGENETDEQAELRLKEMMNATLPKLERFMPEG